MKIVRILSVLFFAILLNCATKQKIGEGEKLSIEREPAAKIQQGKYLGEATITGDLSLYIGKGDDKTLVPFPSGEVKVTLEAPSLFDLGKWIQKDKVVVFTTNDHKFTFRVPKELSSDDGKISVHKDVAEQNAHLIVKEDISLLSEEPEERDNKCTVPGVCNYCRVSSRTANYECEFRFALNCPGLQKARYKVQVFNHTLKINIYNERGSAEIITKANQEKRDVFDVALTPCALK